MFILQIEALHTEKEPELCINMHKHNLEGTLKLTGQGIALLSAPSRHFTHLHTILYCIPEFVSSNLEDFQYLLALLLIFSSIVYFQSLSSY
jgi:hypothetical protein